MKCCFWAADQGDFREFSFCIGFSSSRSQAAFGGVDSAAGVSLLLFNLAAEGQAAADLKLEREYFCRGKLISMKGRAWLQVAWEGGEGTHERAEGANPRGCDYSSSSAGSFPWLHTLPAATAPFPWLPGSRGTHPACPGKAQWCHMIISPASVTCSGPR